MAKKNKPTKKEKDAYILRKYANNGSGEAIPRNLSYEIDSDHEFAYITTIGGKKGITIKKKQ